MSLDQQMQSPVNSTTTQVPVVQSQNQQQQQMPVIPEQAPMETSPDQLLAASNYTNQNNNNMNGSGATQPTHNQYGDQSMQYKLPVNNDKDTNQNFVENTVDMYGNRYRLSPQQEMSQAMQQSAGSLTGADPMLNSVAMITQNQNHLVAYPRKITRSMHQQNLIQLQQGMNGNEDFKMELKCEPENGF